MRNSWAPVFMILVLGCLATSTYANEKSLQFFTYGRLSIQNAADRWCIEESCDGCMNAAFPHIGFPPAFQTSNNERCNTPTFTALSIFTAEYFGFDWVSFVSFFVGKETWQQVLDHCGQDWYNDSHILSGLCNSDALEARGIYQIGDEMSLASLENYIDPNIGPYGQGIPYPFDLALGSFDGLRDAISALGREELTPWKRVFIASLLFYEITGEEFALWCAAHSYVCYQSCRWGWECGQIWDTDLPDIWVPGFPEWDFDWTQQPTFLFHMYYALSDLLDVVVATHQVSWSSVKGLFHNTE